MTPPTPDERAEWREDHWLCNWSRHHAEAPHCATCDGDWPCLTTRTLDALDAAEAVNDKWTVKAKAIISASCRVVELYEVDFGAEWTMPSQFESALIGLSKALADAGGKGGNVVSPPFEVGQRVIWLQRTKGGYGYLYPVNGEVLACKPNHVTIRVEKKDGRQEVIRVKAKHLQLREANRAE